MTDSERSDDEVVDRIVTRHIQRRQRQTDASALVARIRTSRRLDRAIGAAISEGVDGECRELAVGVPSRGSRLPTRRWSGALAWSALVATSVLLAFLGGRHFGPRSANAAAMLRDMRVVHQQGVDRCYRVQYAPDPRTWDQANRLEGPSRSVLWTRGNRFWADCSIGDFRLAIGRAADGSLWVRQSPETGIRFTNDQSQLPQEISLLCAINAMTVPRLVDDVLSGFELTTAATVASSGQTRRLVWASLKPGHAHPLISSAVLEIDPETQTLMRLVLWMVRDGRPKGTVTYTFLDRAVGDQEQYELHWHLSAEARVDTHTLRETR